MRIAVWECDDAMWPAVERICLSCKALPHRVITAHAKGTDLARYDAALICLQGTGEDPDPLAETMSELKAAGVPLIACARHVADWALSARCRVLLAGARQLLDSSASDFAVALESTLSGLLQSLDQERHDLHQLVLLARDNGIIGQSKLLLGAFRQTVQISRLSDLPVLITGESGTGKELFASAIHALDPKRSAHELVAVNCAAINSGVAESELFGHSRGAFTGAARDHGGLFQAANSGVLFLDEIGELSLELQAKILRVLQEKRVRRLGAGSDAVVDVRIVAATNQDLPQMIRAGRFRNDLYHRLNALAIHIEPLRQRRDDLQLLLEHFLDTHRSWKKVCGIAPEFVDALSRLQLAGNVRELKNLVTSTLAAKADEAPLTLKDLPAHVWQELSRPRTTEPDPAEPSGHIDPGVTSDILPTTLAPTDPERWNLDEYLHRCERTMVVAAMKHVRNNQTQAARLLGLTPRSVYNKLRKHQLLDHPAS